MIGHIGDQLDVVAENHVGTDMAERAYANPSPSSAPGSTIGKRMDEGLPSVHQKGASAGVIMAVISASAALAPSTIASQAISRCCHGS